MIVNISLIYLISKIIKTGPAEIIVSSMIVVLFYQVPKTILKYLWR